MYFYERGLFFSIISTILYVPIFENVLIFLFFYIEIFLARFISFLHTHLQLYMSSTSARLCTPARPFWSSPKATKYEEFLGFSSFFCGEKSPLFHTFLGGKLTENPNAPNRRHICLFSALPPIILEQMNNFIYLGTRFQKPTGPAL
jgi:hypothetical protein